VISATLPVCVMECAIGMLTAETILQRSSIVDRINYGSTWLTVMRGSGTARPPRPLPWVKCVDTRMRKIANIARNQLAVVSTGRCGNDRDQARQGFALRFGLHGYCRIE